MPESERRSLPLGWIVATAATMLLVGAVVAGIAAYKQFFNTTAGYVWVYVPTPFGNIMFERDGVSFERRPKFSKRGVRDVQKHVERLMNSRQASLNIYTDADELIGFALTPADSGIRARFALDSSLQPGVESRLRSFFVELGETPARIESDGPGFTLLEYRVDGSPAEVSRVIERVLLEAYGVPSDAGLYFQFDDE